MLPFDAVGPAVEAGEVDAGVVIHEGQLTWQDEGFTKLVDLGEWWAAETDGLPLPLGGNVVRRDLGDEAMVEVARLLKESIVYSLEHREPALDYALDYGRGLARDKADRFVGMYVNDLTVDYGERGREGMKVFLERAYNEQLIPKIPKLDFHLRTFASEIPKWPRLRSDPNRGRDHGGDERDPGQDPHTTDHVAARSMSGADGGRADDGPEIREHGDESEGESDPLGFDEETGQGVDRGRDQGGGETDPEHGRGREQDARCGAGEGGALDHETDDDPPGRHRGAIDEGADQRRTDHGHPHDDGDDEQRRGAAARPLGREGQHRRVDREEEHPA